MSVRHWHRTAILLTGLLLTGCIASGWPIARDPAGSPAGRWVALAPASARLAVGLPGSGPPVLAGRERRTAGGELIQELTLANATAAPGTNLLVVAVDYRRRGLLGLLTNSPAAAGALFQPEELSRLAGNRLNGAAVLGPPAGRSNRYGAYSYLTATFPQGVRCVLAWQVVEREAAALLPPGARRASFQYRYCAADKTETELLQPFDMLSLPA